jgi:hypothetical protein
MDCTLIPKNKSVSHQSIQSYRRRTAYVSPSHELINSRLVPQLYQGNQQLTQHWSVTTTKSCLLLSVPSNEREAASPPPHNTIGLTLDLTHTSICPDSRQIPPDILKWPTQTMQLSTHQVFDTIQRGLP